MNANDVLFSSESDTWYTPKWVIDDLVRPTLGGEIHLDVCSSKAANLVVQASSYYDAVDDGLAQTWLRPSVFMNPPYGRGRGILAWITKLMQELGEGNIKEAVVLVAARTDTHWFEPLFQADVLGFIHGRLQYDLGTESIGVEGELAVSVQSASRPGGIAPFPSVLAYFGPNPKRACRLWEPSARCVIPTNQVYSFIGRST